jgi:hypothetical protein
MPLPLPWSEFRLSLESFLFSFWLAKRNEYASSLAMLANTSLCNHQFFFRLEAFSRLEQDTEMSKLQRKTSNGIAPEQRRRPSRIVPTTLLGPAEDAPGEASGVGLSSALLSADGGTQSPDEDTVSLWQLLVTQHNIDVQVKEHDAVRLDPVKIIRKVSPETAKILEKGTNSSNATSSSTAGGAKFFDIRALVEMIDIRRTATDDHAITPCRVFRERLEFFRRFATGYREKFIRWEILRISMLSGFHTDAVLADKRAGRELTIPLKASRVRIVFPDSYDIRMAMLNDPLFVQRVLWLHQTLTLTRGPITRSAYFGLYRCFIKVMLLHLSDSDIHRLITIDFDVDCAEFLAMKKMQAIVAAQLAADEEQEQSVGRTSQRRRSSKFTRLGTFADYSWKPGSDRAVEASTSDAGQPVSGPDFFSRKQSIRSVATIRSWLRDQGKSHQDDAELDPVVMGSVDFLRWVSSLVMIWLETHAVSECNGLLDSISQLWISESDKIDVEFADRFVSKVKSTEPSTVPLVPPSACVSEQHLLSYVKRHMITTIKARYPKFMVADTEQQPRFSEPLHLTSIESSAALLKQNLNGRSSSCSSESSQSGLASSASSSPGLRRRRRSSLRLIPEDGWPFVINAAKLHEDARASQTNDIRQAQLDHQHAPSSSSSSSYPSCLTALHEDARQHRRTVVMFSSDDGTPTATEMAQSVVLDTSQGRLGSGDMLSSSSLFSSLISPVQSRKQQQRKQKSLPPLARFAPTIRCASYLSSIPLMEAQRIAGTTRGVDDDLPVWARQASISASQQIVQHSLPSFSQNESQCDVGVGVDPLSARQVLHTALKCFGRKKSPAVDVLHVRAVKEKRTDVVGADAHHRSESVPLFSNSVALARQPQLPGPGAGRRAVDYRLR